MNCVSKSFDIYNYLYPYFLHFELVIKNVLISDFDDFEF